MPALELRWPPNDSRGRDPGAGRNGFWSRRSPAKTSAVQPWFAASVRRVPADAAKARLLQRAHQVRRLAAGVPGWAFGIEEIEQRLKLEPGLMSIRAS
jgi:hypothetical protein